MNEAEIAARRQSECPHHKREKNPSWIPGDFQTMSQTANLQCAHCGIPKTAYDEQARMMNAYRGLYGGTPP